MQVTVYEAVRHIEEVRGFREICVERHTRRLALGFSLGPISAVSFVDGTF